MVVCVLVNAISHWYRHRPYPLDRFRSFDELHAQKLRDAGNAGSGSAAAAAAAADASDDDHLPSVVIDQRGNVTFHSVAVAPRSNDDLPPTFVPVNPNNVIMHQVL